ncbi:MAG TPA: hypothetical protein VD905_21865, partial [Flavobacteriales bacterium]|nr:hypothetical protein [Flavobacteriales bacterium]
HFYIITFACISLSTIPFILKYKQSLTLAGNWYVIQQTITSSVSVYIQEVKPDMAGTLCTMSFILFIFFIFGVRRAIARLIPFVSIFILTLVLQTMNITVDLGIPESQQLPNQPFVALVPFFLCFYLVVVFMRTNSKAEKQIQGQKQMVEAKNKEITDSIHYSKRIQTALMPTEERVEKVIKRLKS